MPRARLMRVLCGYAILKIEEKMISVLPNFCLTMTQGVTEAFLALGLLEFHSAINYIWHLPYGRNSNRADFKLVLAENRGTCSTKHALLAQLALEQGVSVHLMLGIFEMNGENTPSVGSVLKKYGLACLPEAHCYLSSEEGARVDLTLSSNVNAQPATSFVYEERIRPDQIGEYKVGVHKSYLRKWMRYCSLDERLNFDEVWKIRESCITALDCAT